MKFKNLVCPSCNTTYREHDFRSNEAPYCKICGYPVLDEVIEEIDRDDLTDGEGNDIS